MLERTVGAVRWVFLGASHRHGGAKEEVVRSSRKQRDLSAFQVCEFRHFLSNRHGAAETVCVLWFSFACGQHTKGTDL
jgi:hypothetical protein